MFYDNERLREINRFLDALPHAVALAALVVGAFAAFVMGVARAIAAA